MIEIGKSMSSSWIGNVSHTGPFIMALRKQKQHHTLNALHIKKNDGYIYKFGQATLFTATF